MSLFPLMTQPARDTEAERRRRVQAIPFAMPEKQMRTTYRWDKDLEALVEVRGNANYFEERGQAPAVISDDIGAGVNGLRHMPSGKMLDSKSEHRRETKARGLEEIGNSTDFASKRPSRTLEEYGQMVRDSRDQIAGNYNGTADRLQRDREHSNGN